MHRVGAIAADAHGARERGVRLGDGIIPELRRRTRRTGARRRRRDDPAGSGRRSSSSTTPSTLRVGARRGYDFPGLPSRRSGMRLSSVQRSSCAAQLHVVVRARVAADETRAGRRRLRERPRIKGWSAWGLRYRTSTRRWVARRATGTVLEQRKDRVRVRATCASVPGTSIGSAAGDGSVLAGGVCDRRRRGTATVEELERLDGMIRDVRAAIRSIRTDEEVLKLTRRRG